MGTVKTFRGGGVTLWALLVSLGVHLVVFVIFSFVQLSGGRAGFEQVSASSVPVAQIKKIIAMQAVVPKPKIKRIDADSARGKRAVEFDLTERVRGEYSFESRGQFYGSWQDEMPGTGYNDPVTEFFGSTTDLRKICYVVDGSGSMQGRLSMVKAQLTDSIARLRADQFFYIIIFQGDRLLESGRGRLVRATEKAKSRANEFVDSIRFEGPTNAFNALERAMTVKDFTGKNAQQIYFLSDGFDLDNQTTTDFAQLIAEMRKRLAPALRINTIGFWVESRDIKILKAIAAQSGGQFVNVE